MKIGPKYKISRRLGAPVFGKCQTEKYALSVERKSKIRRGGRRPRPLSDFGKQLLEKQKVRYSYYLSEKQFSRYVREAAAQKAISPKEALFGTLETRLDSIVFRLGFAGNSRALARQIVSHGHITVNGRKVTIPSYHVRQGDVIGIRPQSAKKTLFADLDERLKGNTPPPWIAFDAKKREGKLQGAPNLEQTHDGLMFDLVTVIEFYSR